MSTPDPDRERAFDPRRLGADGEQVVAEWYRSHGYDVVGQNWRCAEGELDLVLEGPDGGVVICEVKTRSGTRFGTPFDAVGPRKQARLRRLAARWLREHPVPPREVRFDVAGVIGRRVEVIEAAF